MVTELQEQAEYDRRTLEALEGMTPVHEMCEGGRGLLKGRRGQESEDQMNTDDQGLIVARAYAIANQSTDEQLTPHVQRAIDVPDAEYTRLPQFDRAMWRLLQGGADPEHTNAPFRRAIIDVAERNDRRPPPPIEPLCSHCDDTGKVTALRYHGLKCYGPDESGCRWRGEQHHDMGDGDSNRCNHEANGPKPEADDRPIDVGDYVEVIEANVDNDRWVGKRGVVTEVDGDYHWPFRVDSHAIPGIWCKVRRAWSPTEDTQEPKGTP